MLPRQFLVAQDNRTLPVVSEDSAIPSNPHTQINNSSQELILILTYKKDRLFVTEYDINVSIQI